MDPEDGVIWVYGIDDEGVITVTDFGIKNLMELIRYTRKTLNPSSAAV